MTADELAEKMMAKINCGRMHLIKDAHKGGGTHAKFFEVVDFSHAAAQIAIGMGLDYGPRRDVLDIGCGLGYFCLACELLGHQAIGIDSASELITDVASMGVPFQFHGYSIEAQKPVKPFENENRFGQFDLISIYGVNFASPAGFWTEADYRFLIDDLYGRLNPNGEIWLNHNYGEHTDFIGRIQWPYTFTQVRNLCTITRDS